MDGQSLIPHAVVPTFDRHGDAEKGGAVYPLLRGHQLVLVVGDACGSTLKWYKLIPMLSRLRVAKEDTFHITLP